MATSPIVKGVMVSRRQRTASRTKDQPQESSDTTSSLSPHGKLSGITPQGTVGVTIRGVPLFTTECSVKPDEMQALIQEAAEHTTSIHDEVSAREWAGAYVFPPQYLRSDVACLRAAQRDFVVMVRRRLTLLSENRLNPARISGLHPDNPERKLLLDLAGGMRVTLPQGFMPNGSTPPTPLRATYLAVAPAVNKMLGDVISQGLAFLLPVQLARECIPNLHLAKCHWTRKKGKASGRPLGDLTFVDGTPLNTEETKDAASAYYGAIVHPTIEDIAAMVGTFWARTLLANPVEPWSNIKLWKMDLKGAYTLLSYRPENAGLFGMLLTDDLVYLQIAGIFGWSGTPACFQVVTRAISFELRNRLASASIMYVDDIIGVGLAKDIEEDLAITRAICTNLLGPTAVADDKTEVGRRLDVIGYTIDLDTQRVVIARKNHLTAVHGFYSVATDTTTLITLKTAQRLASWGSRYGKICRVMRPFCAALYNLSAGRTNLHAMFHLSSEAAMAIRCWRAMLCLVRYRETDFTRTLESFVPTASTVVAEFDASLQGAGVVWYFKRDGAEVAGGVSAVDLSFLSFGEDSSYQNLSEFIGAIIAVAGQVILGRHSQSMSLRGDSITALTWAISERPKGERVTRAAIIWTMLCVAVNVNIDEITHIAGKNNHLCDALSRRGSNHHMSVREHAAVLGVAAAVVIDVAGDADIMALLELCRPRTDPQSDAEFVSFWGEARRTIIPQEVKSVCFRKKILPVVASNSN